MKKLLFFFCMLFFPFIVWAQLLPIEKQIRTSVLQQKESQIAFLKDLVNIQSGTSNPQGVHQVGERVRKELEQMGFRTKWFAEPAFMHHAGTLIATNFEKTKTTKAKKILLIGHLDTVFAPDSSFKDFQIHKNIAKGPGVTDDKGGLAVLIYALKALHANHALSQSQITIVLTGDEEDSGKPTTISRKPLVDAAQGLDVALDFEPAISLDTATVARRGVTNWSIETHGKEAHSSGIFGKEVGFGAIFELERILHTARLAIAKEKHATFNPGVLVAGTKISFDKTKAEGVAFGKENVIANSALARGDFRFLSAMQKDNIKNKLIRITQNHLSQTNAKISFEDGIPAMSPSQNNSALLKKFSNVSEDLGQGKITALPAELRGAGDISHVSNIVPANLSGLGAEGDGEHSLAEQLNLKSLPVQTTRAAILIYRLSRENA